jgi:NAD(P)-dependent dehydrogenase (short-subunit alcohol dehydrogenase family)
MGESHFTLLSGASSAIGEAIAISLSAERRLVLHGRDESKLQALRSRCHEPSKHQIWLQDFRELPQVAVSLERALTANQWRVDAFVHAAGVVVRGPVRLISLEQVQESLAVNFVSAQEVLSVLIKRRVNGDTLRDVVAISSIAASFGVRGHAAYCAAKAALDGWIRAIAIELAPRVRANSLVLGPVSTPATEHILAQPEVAARISTACPTGVGKPEDAAATVRHLLSEDLAWMTGQQIVVDGGFTADATI